MYGIYINCKKNPFIDWIISGQKTSETRTKNVLAPLVGKTVYIIETGTSRKPIVRAIADVVSSARVPFEDIEARRLAMIAGTDYDIKPGSFKVFYRLENVRSVAPFLAPDTRVNAGRSYTEF